MGQSNLGRLLAAASIEDSLRYSTTGGGAASLSSRARGSGTCPVY